MSATVVCVHSSSRQCYFPFSLILSLYIPFPYLFIILFIYLFLVLLLLSCCFYFSLRALGELKRCSRAIFLWLLFSVFAVCDGAWLWLPLLMLLWLCHIYTHTHTYIYIIYIYIETACRVATRPGRTHFLTHITATFWWFISFFGSAMIISVTQRGCGSVQNRRRRVGHEIHSQFLSTRIMQHGYID